MKTSHRLTRSWVVFVAPVLLSLLATGCSKEGRKARHLERGDEYYTQEQYREAVLEYRNVLTIEPENQHAIERLGLAHFQLGELAQSFPQLSRMKELAPGNLESRVKLATIYLLARQVDEARAEVEDILAADPENLDGLILQSDTSASIEEVNEAFDALTAVQAQHDTEAKYHLALGSLHVKKQDIDSAEVEFNLAAEREPGSVTAHQALANFYLAKRELDRAEEEFKKAAELAPAGSPSRIRLAEFYVVTNRRDDAKTVLTSITNEAPDYVPAWHRLAAIAFDARDLEEAETAVQAALDRNESDPIALLLKGRIQLARRDSINAVQSFQAILDLQPDSAPARYYLAQAQLQEGNVQQAKSELRQAMNAAPNFGDAVFALSELNVRTNATGTAIEDLNNFRDANPNNPRVYQVLGTAHLRQREFDRAIEQYEKFTELAPQDPRGPHLVGIGHRAKGDLNVAKGFFRQSLEIAPAYIDPLGQLITIASIEGNPAEALRLVEDQIRKVPDSGPLHYLLGRVRLLRRETTEAEEAYLKAVELEPRLVGAYTDLGNLYAITGKYDDALTKFNDALTVNPDNPATNMLLGIVHHQKGDVPQAQAAYEKVLELNPRFAAAANNLAYIYSQNGDTMDRALELAQQAKEVAPDDANISDTLAWILYKKDEFLQAEGLLEQAMEKLGENAEVNYHLGMVRYKLGNNQGARDALSKALELGSDFNGADEARTTLGELGS